MTKAQIIKFAGTALAFVAGGGALLIPSPYQAVAMSVSTLLLGWLHLPQPGTVKVSS
jgi:hypothetical protein